ncbi:MAG: type VI secretion system baseplate subunit TssE [Paraburkholderia tropica]|uniref:Type VI secretion system protein n=1 Tax=Paraburkholderia tropica TaxID=92647 RepID=A0ABX5MFP2_9BURK|nr:type VI secretion system baseplate subunit TssE [Paraburkholderia tropica]MDE1139873.1 type VI secretion system baseplate subunit TssE [Paraburkholderia tropica]PXX09006.1 type VI secretion system protein [Paraburkholderia tropica]PZW74223.1 type VI secretion system protein [Paraburkholderia tropica]QNB16867.1 type VI secretion system baseplate subunit TssE [Paraburkholderia tropica]
MPRSRGQGSLFERLDPDAPPVRNRQQQVAGRVLAIRQHLQWLLNSRQGCSQSSPELGLRDFNDALAGTTDLMLRLRGEIEVMVRAFEPRVVVLGVRACPRDEQPLDLHFRLDCLVPVQHKDEQVEIDLVISHRNRQAHVA